MVLVVVADVEVVRLYGIKNYLRKNFHIIRIFN